MHRRRRDRGPATRRILRRMDHEGPRRPVQGRAGIARMVMQQLEDDLWVESRSLRFMGLETGTRMTVVKLSSGKLFVHSPVSLTDPLKDEIAKLGEVAAIVAPSKFHHLYVGEWTRAHPNAVVCPCPTLERKRTDIAW